MYRRQTSFHELPISGLRTLGYTVPIAGGNYLRQLPRWLTRKGIEQWIATGVPLVAYFHIWELDTRQPSITGASRVQRLRHYRNLDQMREKFAYFIMWG